MNWANRITVLRILLVPLFVAMLHYFRVSEPAVAEPYRFLAILIFALSVFIVPNTMQAINFIS